MPEAGTLLGVWAAGLLAGIASGLFGVGGGILMVPAALYLVPDTTFHEAKAVSLVVILGSASIGAWTHHRQKSVDVRAGLVLALGGLLGTAASAIAAERIAAQQLALAFGIVLALTGARLLAPQAPQPRALAPRTRDLTLLALGLAGGLLAGALGVGGGIIMVPGMVLAGIGMHLAIGTSLLAILGNAAAATTSHLALGYGPTLATLGIPLALGAIPGTHLGARLAHKLHADKLRRAFGAALVVVGLGMAIDAWR